MGFVRRAASVGFSAVAVLGCAAVAVAMARSGTAPDPRPAAVSAAPMSVGTPPAWTQPASRPSTSAASVVPPSAVPDGSDAATPAVPATSSSPAPPPPAPASSTPRAPAAPPAAAQPPPPAAQPPPAAPAPVRGGALPLRYGTADARQVITVVAPSTGSTTATLQAWAAAPGGGWLAHGPAVAARVGSQGLSASPSESRSATPMGSFTLTQAFGRNANPGTALGYFQTTPADWWISQAGPLYNTHQRCSGNCPFIQGSPNEHLAAIWQYAYAVVIDYNTPNAGQVRQGAGSAFFLHVSDGSATAGCVSIAQDQLVNLLRWLDPGARPRILIGTG